MKILKEIRRKIKAWLYTKKLKKEKKTEQERIKSMNIYSIVIVKKDDHDNENYFIIPIENISYTYIGDIYDDEYKKYKTRKTIVLKDGTKHKIYDKDKVVLIEKIDIEKYLNK